MPELPDVEIFKRRAEHSIGRTVDQVIVNDPGSVEGGSAATLQQRLHGRHLTSCQRHGKHLFIAFEDAATLALHFGMTGSLQMLPRDAEEPRFVRFMLTFDDGERLAYADLRRLGRVRLIDSVAAFVADEKLGPDVLEAAFDEAAFAHALDRRKQPVKVVLMDQARMSGVGNIYADEILFQAKLHPATPANSLDNATQHRLFRAAKQVLQTAIDRGAGAENFIDRLPKGYLLPERHAGGHCPRCGTPLATSKIGGRTSYHCPKCQRAPGT